MENRWRETDGLTRCTALQSRDFLRPMSSTSMVSPVGGGREGGGGEGGEEGREW